MLSRRRFIQASGGLLTLPSFLEARVLADASKFYFAIIADTHIIDEFYRGPESNPEDTESMFKTRERLIAARDTINALQPAMEQVFLVGDYFHDYSSTDVDFYFQHTTRIDHAKELTSALPYGLRKRVELGRALALDPTLLLLDEPMGGMNQEEKEDVARYILDVNEQWGTTIILIEHDMAVVMDISDRVAVLDRGRKIAEGTPAQVQRDPAVILAYLGSAHQAREQAA